jgi:hypothetical protein
MDSRSKHGYDTKIVSVTRFDNGVVAEEDLAARLLLRSSLREAGSIIAKLEKRWFRHHIIVVYALLCPSLVIHRPLATSGVYL